MFTNDTNEVDPGTNSDPMTPTPEGEGEMPASPMGEPAEAPNEPAPEGGDAM